MSALAPWISLELLTCLLVGSALLANRLLRSRSAAIRHALLASTLLAVLVLPLARIALPALEVAVPANWVGALGHVPEEAPMVVVRPVEMAGRQSSETAVRTASTPAQLGVPSPRVTPPPWRVVLATWLAGFLGLSGRWILGLAILRRSVRSARPLPSDSPWRTSYRALSSSTRVRLLESDQTAFPATGGFLQPFVLIPTTASRWSEDRCRNVLLHELAHVDRQDWLVQMLCRLCCAVHWANPLVWFALRETLRLAEEACDDQVILGGSSGERYAEELVRTVREVSARSEPPVFSVAVASRSGLARRIDRLLDSTQQRTASRSKRFFGLTVVAATSLALTLGVVRVTASQQDGDRDSALAEAMIEAAERGDLRTLEQLPRAVIDVDMLHNSGGTLLIAAVRSGNRELVRRLLEWGADPDLVASGDGSPLLVAAERGDLAVMRLLLDHGADVDRDAPGDGNPLIAAARAGQLDAVRFLVTSGANVDSIVKGDETPLIQAAGHGHLEIVRFLLDSGSDPNLTVYEDAGGLPLRGGPRSPLSVARRGGYDGVVDLLLSGGAR